MDYAWEASIRGPGEIQAMGEAKHGLLSSIGMSGLYLFQYRAMTKGHALIKLTYGRPFEKSMPPLRICEVPVYVK